MPRPTDDFAEADKEEAGRLEMERNWRLRRENVLPLEAAWNEGRFYGLALKGAQRLTGVQRFGVFILGILFVGTALLMPFLSEVQLGPVGPSLRSIYQRLPNVSLVWIPVALLELALGLRFCWVAYKRPTDRPIE